MTWAGRIKICVLLVLVRMTSSFRTPTRPLLTKPHPRIAHHPSSVRTWSLKASLSDAMSNYIQEYLLPPIENTNYHIYSSLNDFLTTSNLQPLSSEPQFHRDYIIFIDYHIRSTTDFLSSFSSTFTQFHPLHSKLTKASQKLQSSKESFSHDKICSSFDVGDERVEKVSIVRIPPDVTQKADIARRLAETHKSSDITTVIMLSLQEVMMDQTMAELLFSAFQLARFPLPSLKAIPTTTTATTSATSATTQSTMRHNSLKDLANLMLAESGDLKKSGKEEKVKIIEFIDVSQPSSSSLLSSEIEVKEQTKSLEEIMLEEAKKRYGSMIKTPDTPIPATLPSKSAILSQSLSERLDRTVSMNHGTNIARALAMLPPNFLNPANYVTILRDFARHYHWDITVIPSLQLQEMGCGAFTAVTAANPPDSDYLVYLRYYRNKENESDDALGSNSELLRFRFEEDEVGGLLELDRKKPVVLVGKGVTYDTGGLSLKNTKHMRTMKHDMAGSSVALGVFLSLFLQKEVDHAECWLAIAENNIGQSSYRPDDIVRSLSGETIEIMDTDAEGRMLLADTLSLASRKVEVKEININPPISLSTITSNNKIEPALIIDFATLTGTAITALTSRYISLFTNREQFLPILIKAGKESGEKAWPFPLDQEMLEELKTSSSIADILQCRAGGEADHIFAALFLQQFVKSGVPWIHCDLGSAHRVGGLGLVSSEYTGSGVRLAHHLIQQLFKRSNDEATT